MDSNEKFMLRALELAELGRGSVEPNPMVGAVIVCDGEIIGEGYHEKFGCPHAEVNAINAAKSKGKDLRGATIYVTLEPCSHYGKTPPCADTLVAEGFAKVVVAMDDPDENVSGRGIEKLRRAGIEVITNFCEARAKELLRAYIKSRTLRQPWVMLKWAQTKNGYLALPKELGRWISCDESLKKVHEMRSWCDGILVGVSTVLADDPMLNNRSGGGREPARIVLDSTLRTPPDSKLAATAKEYPTIIATSEESAASKKAAQLRDIGVEIIALPVEKTGLDLNALLDELGRRKFTYLLVEGGARVLRSFLTQKLADEVLVFTAPFDCNDPAMPRFDINENTDGLELVRRCSSGSDELSTYRVRVSDKSLFHFV